MYLCGPFPSGESVVVVIDAYFRFPEVDILKSTTAPSIINKLDRIFSTHRFPDSVTSDNGPQFACHEMEDYFSQRGIKHHHVSPLWPQANGLVESFMKPLDKAIRTAHAQGQVWQKELPCSIIVRRHTPRQKWPLHSCYLIEWLTMGSQQTRIFTQLLHKSMRKPNFVTLSVRRTVSCTRI